MNVPVTWTYDGLTFTFDAPAAIIVVLVLLLFYMLWKANSLGHLDWTDMITSKSTRKVSLTKLLQLVGGITGTWIMIFTTLQGDLTGEILFIYLAYVGAIEGWSKFVAAKYSISQPTQPTLPLPNTQQQPNNRRQPHNPSPSVRDVDLDV